MSKLKEAYLRSGIDLKTINGKSIIGSGDIEIDTSIPENSIGSAELKNNAVTTTKINAKAVTEQKLADAVTDKLLPTVTSSDAGKVASVDENGDWVAATAGGGGGDEVVTFTENDGVYSADKTLAELKTAWESGKNIRAYYPSGGVAPPLVYTD